MREWMKKEREKSGLSQQNVADLLGITKQYYQQIEAGQRQKRMATDLLLRFATVFKKSPTQIIKLEKAYADANKE